ncbi:Uma2 family endonuclease [Solwaraspora sp. WMMA2059]|uniref:Uma2 family endonuclease n=1 Tax=Solwaraspora sp. WMMA2059 TaxID=3015160 RepID=UPI00248C2840|nr:Uma2 family endonuclease [Solwaraspora sp. WMMA2059]WBB97945.1 Uma2 family endonuclease [Solwaraspora sp. WMMA2059]
MARPSCLRFALRPHGAGASRRRDRAGDDDSARRTERPEPDLLATRAPYYDPDCTFYTPDQVLLVVEVVSPESDHRDRTVKLRKYAEAGIPHYWRVEDEGGSPVVHAYELDEPTRSYVATGIHRHELHTTTPFELKLNLDGLVPGRKS